MIKFKTTTIERPLISVMLHLKNQKKANRLFGLCLPVWHTVFFDRFIYAIIE